MWLADKLSPAQRRPASMAPWLLLQPERGLVDMAVQCTGALDSHDDYELELRRALPMNPAPRWYGATRAGSKLR